MSSVNAGGSPIKAYSYEKSGTAQTLKNSEGTEKSRIHLLSYEGVAGQDRYAVFAKEKVYASDADAKLGWLDRKRFILYKHVDGTGQPTWYKINKNSLKKRLGISSKDLDVDKKTGKVGGKLEKLVAAKQAELDKLNDRSGAKTPFQKAFIRELLARVDMTNYGDNIVFFPSDTSPKEVNLSDAKLRLFNGSAPRSHLYISYKKIYYEFPQMPGEKLKEVINIKPDSPVVWLEIDHDSFEKILAGEPMPKKILDKVDPKLGLVSGKISLPINSKEKMTFDFDANTRRTDIKKWMDEVEVRLSTAADTDNKKANITIGDKRVGMDFAESIASSAIISRLKHYSNTQST